MLIQGDGPKTATPFPFTGNGAAVWLPVIVPGGYALAHVDDGPWFGVVNIADPVKTVPQAKVDEVNKISGPDYRAWLEDCGKSGSGGTVDLGPVLDAINAVSAKLDGLDLADAGELAKLLAAAAQAIVDAQAT